MFTQRNISYVLVGKDLAATTATRAENLLDGEVAITNVFGQVLTSGTGVKKIMIHQGGSTRVTDVITAADVVNVKTKGYAAATEQVDFIGYNGTAGSIVVANSNDYFVRLQFPFGDRGQEFPQQNFIFAHYLSDATATQAEIAKNLANVMNADARKRYERDLRVELICDNAGVAVTGAPTNLTFTQDSKTVVWTGTDPTNIVAGVWLRVGGTTTASPVYEVASIDAASNTLQLVTPFVGATATVLVANVEMITAALADAAAFGMKLIGIPRKFRLKEGVRYRKAKWIPTIQGFGSTLITRSVASFLGSGVYEQVAEEDLFGDIIFGNGYSRVDVRFQPNLYAEVGGQYGCVTIVWDDKTNHTIGPNSISRKSARIFFNNQASAQAVEFLTTLGEVMNTTYTF
jgi:hypothetical protein